MKRVLVVDDSLTVRMDISDALEAAGFGAVGCASLEAAADALTARGADLVILDVLLPDGDGVEYLRTLRASATTARVPVILLSTEAEVRSRVLGIGAGADEYIGKPYDIAQVVARARALTHATDGRPAGSNRRLLVVDDSVTFRRELTKSLEAGGYEVHEAVSGEEALAMAADLRPDAVVVDGVLPGIDGVTVVRRLKSDATLRSTPCVLLTGADGTAEELRSLEAGADAYVRKSEDLGVILARLAALLRTATSNGRDPSPSLLGPKRLLAVDDSETYLHVLSAELGTEGYDVVLATSGREALALLGAQSVDCILLDLQMPGLSGQETCLRIKESTAWRDIPLVILSACEDRSAIIDGINAGADDYIVKSPDLDILKARIRAQLRRKHFEDETRRNREQLVRKEIEARFQQLIHSNIIGIVLGNLGGQLTDANDAFLTMVGYSRADLQAGALRWTDLAAPEWQDRLAVGVEELRERGSTTPFEQEYVRKDGTRLPLVLGLTLMEQSDALVGFVLDRTEQQAAAEKLRTYSVALEGANRELESFSYSIAHDLRAPLRSIDGFSQVLLDDYADRLDDEGKRYLGFVRESTQHMAHLIDDLLALSRVTRTELQRESVDLGTIARATVTRLERGDPARQVEVTISDGLRAEADPRLLGVVFENLLGNAWKFTSKRDGARIGVGTLPGDSPRTYFVRDNGAGFDMAFAQKLFGVFQRLHSTAEFEGTGIGLAIVNRIISRHGGRIWAESEIAKGATFYFTLGDEKVMR
jgi:PAS domain S-box-containing protein